MNRNARTVASPTATNCFQRKAGWVTLLSGESQYPHNTPVQAPGSAKIYMHVRRDDAGYTREEPLTPNKEDEYDAKAGTILAPPPGVAGNRRSSRCACESLRLQTYATH